MAIKDISFYMLGKDKTVEEGIICFVISWKQAIITGYSRWFSDRLHTIFLNFFKKKKIIIILNTRLAQYVF